MGEAQPTVHFGRGERGLKLGRMVQKMVRSERRGRREERGSPGAHDRDKGDHPGPRLEEDRAGPGIIRGRSRIPEGPGPPRPLRLLGRTTRTNLEVHEKGRPSREGHWLEAGLITTLASGPGVMSFHLPGSPIRRRGPCVRTKVGTPGPTYAGKRERCWTMMHSFSM